MSDIVMSNVKSLKEEIKKLEERVEFLERRLLDGGANRIGGPGVG